jgi:transcriptional regulator with XRE-family HTH domain
VLYKEIISKKLKKLMKERFGTQKNMAKELSLHEGLLSKWLNGKVMPSLELLQSIVIKCSLPPEYFFVDSEDSIDEELFDEVFYYAYKLAEENNIEISGKLFLACYQSTKLCLKDNPNISVEKAFNNIKPILLKLVKNSKI